MTRQAAHVQGTHNGSPRGGQGRAVGGVQAQSQAEHLEVVRHNRCHHNRRPDAYRRAHKQQQVAGGNGHEAGGAGPRGQGAQQLCTACTVMEEQIKVANHRISDLEKAIGGK